MSSNAVPADADESLTPTRPVAAGTPQRELERLALQERTHPEAVPLEIQTVIWLFRAYNAAAGEFAASLRPLGLSPSGFNVLQALVNTREQELEPCQLAERLLVSRPSVTGLIDTLEAKELVGRRRHPEDRRRILVGLTDKARELLRCHYAEHYALLGRIAGGLSDDEMATLVSLLRRLHGATPPELAAPPTHAEPPAHTEPNGGSTS